MAKRPTLNQGVYSVARELRSGVYSVKLYDTRPSGDRVMVASTIVVALSGSELLAEIRQWRDHMTVDITRLPDPVPPRLQSARKSG